ncbi:sulfotransferase [Parvibaculum sp.]|uniref:sulfotransferase family protein n=1 Tax=Parvibaculum sp. TaxID=2024848 RepID=UPI000EE64D6B|nr:sulfotransferase [Parvibaculum sp.]MBO6669275.1 sulfotransferase [Parvibaculum sp.]MBO6693499.1 sulfotransferase [Parvibaculum sp.]MBO6712959.1 sulfotransferase [Parvibaculum sp.]HAC60454.1 hypothetical protein [Rhodobiaceae bacterium]
MLPLRKQPGTAVSGLALQHLYSWRFRASLPPPLHAGSLRDFLLAENRSMTDMPFRGYAFIIGAMKCGTTTLHTLLEQHPAITVSQEKEPNFFKKAGETCAEDYEKIFPELDKTRHVWTLDGSTSYSKTKRWPNPPKRIAELPGEKRIIYLMRDPVARIESHIAHSIARGRWQKNYDVKLLKDASSYAQQIAAYETAGLLNDMMLIDFDELCREPIAMATRVFEFLGLDIPDIVPVPPQNTRRTQQRFMPEEDATRWRKRLNQEMRTLVEKYGFEAEWTRPYLEDAPQPKRPRRKPR